MVMVIILAVSVVVAVVVVLAQFRIFGTAQGQGNLTEGNMTLTPEQRNALCNPNNPLSKLKSVNTTESEICGIPKTQPLNATSAANITAVTGAPSPPSSPIPGLFMPEQPPSQPTQSESIQPPPAAKSIAPRAVPPPLPP
jgi:hypothetical protein